MPNLSEHCRRSLTRTGKSFSDLHIWMDAPQKELGVKHRSERHDSSWMDYVSKKWGTEGVIEFLYHIEIDNRNTREKIESNITPQKNSGLELKIVSSNKKKFDWVYTCSVCGSHNFYELKGIKICVVCLK